MENIDKRDFSTARNRVFINKLAIGKNMDYALKTKEDKVYRVTGMDQIEDIVDCGYIRPRDGKLKGGEKTFYFDKRPVLEVGEDKVKEGQLGALSIDDLSSIWMFDSNENEYVDRLDFYKKVWKQKNLIERATSLEEVNVLLNDEETFKFDNELVTEDMLRLMQNIYKKAVTSLKENTHSEQLNFIEEKSRRI